jgi:hypothetical protein
MTRFRSKAARLLTEAIDDAEGGSWERVGTGKLRITGPTGSITIHEPGGDTRRDLRRSGAARKISEQTGLTLGGKP